MEVLEHNIEREKNFVRLFGFSVIETRNKNRWNIVDKNNKCVGYIVYKKFKKDKESLELDENNTSRYIGYQMIINTDDIHYNKGRSIADTDMSHFFTIKTKRYGVVNISLNFGDNLSLIMYCNEDEQEERVESVDWINCIIDEKTFQLQIKSNTESYNTYEQLVYESNTEKTVNGRKKYQYWLKFCRKPFEIDDCRNTRARIRSIDAFSSSADVHNNRMIITESGWIGKRHTVNNKYVVNGSIEELAEQQELGISAVNHFRAIANNVFPFEEDVIEKLCDGLIGKRDDLAMFFPEFGSQNMPKELQYK